MSLNGDSTEKDGAHTATEAPDASVQPGVDDATDKPDVKEQTETEAEQEAEKEAEKGQETGQEAEPEKKPDLLDAEKLQREFQERVKTYLAEQTAHVIIPSFAKWFDLSKIHPIEKKSFPDFFNDETVYKNPNGYKYIRDFLVNTFRLNPKEYLTITSVRRNLAGDVTIIIRIHQFLEKWGLINYQIDPKTKSVIVGPQYTGHFQITLDAPEGLTPYIPENATVSYKSEQSLKLEGSDVGGAAGGAADGAAATASATPNEEKMNGKEKPDENDPLQLNVEVKRNVYETGEKRLDFKANNSVHYACSICGKDTTEVRYHNLKIKSYTYNPNSTINNASILCAICYDQGLFPSNFSCSDFVELRNSESAHEWTEQEVLLLLEGIEMFATHEAPSAASGNINVNTNNQWNKISEHVATKSKEECLKKFIQLPIEDRFLTKLIKEEPQGSSAEERANLIEEIVSKLIKSKDGKDLLASNAKENAQKSHSEQTNLINQIIEMTVEKVQLKLETIDELQADLIAVQNQLTKERKLNLMERWAQYHKIQKLKQERPDLSDILSDLLRPVKLHDADQNDPSSSSADMEVDDDAASTAHTGDDANGESDDLPVSYTKPKEYQFWSG
ncbi:uncharacterized protein LODBEIA_P12990 [Lodderomyces beijingensis]|uniref:Chromatin structure-remodeling complex protein RSC8 n=1 Tax=Lodderomyces beijingensis TaxID=1775926 RepID=A0ABP0ZFX2_9ASCO